MIEKIRRIRDDSITPEDVEEIAAGDSESSSTSVGSTYIEGNNVPHFIKHGGTRRFMPLTPQEERDIKEELNPLASAIALYNSDESCSDLPMNEFVCMVVELEEARKAGKI
jgi:hypothetical protein